MKIATFNINGVNKRLANLLAWLEAAKPDVACLQEIKCTDREFPHREVRAAGYGAIWRGQGPHHGVAILVRDGDPIETRRALPGDDRDAEARYIEAAVDGVLVGCIYLPNGNPHPGPKFTYKLAWFERLIAHAADLHAANIPAVLAGDYNVVPTDAVADIYNPRSWHKNALLQPQPRAAYERLMNAGWTDALRSLYPATSLYTFWDYMRDSWPRDAGMRLDHFLLTPKLAEHLVRGGIDREVRDAANASDHAPAWIAVAG